MSGSSWKGAAPAFEMFLQASSGSGADVRRFVARNARLDASMPAERMASYRRVGAAAAHPDVDTWQGFHKGYLGNFVNVPGTGGAAPSRLDPTDASLCPETFAVPAISPYAAADPSQNLVRLERVEGIARWARIPTAEAVGVLRNAKADPSAANDLLANWRARVDLRPCFAGFWDDLKHLFGASPTTDKHDWADSLRDGLGLVHLNPDPTTGTPSQIPVVLFKYRVMELPMVAGAPPNTRPAVPPTVLDQDFSPAFCPTPAGSIRGYTVDLSGARPGRFQEILHPAMNFRASHVFRVGEIRRPVRADALTDGRRKHIVAIRAAVKEPDWAAATDGDLL